MKTNLFKILIASLCGICVMSAVFADDSSEELHTFIGTSIGIVHNAYKYDTVAKYGISSDKVSVNFISDFAYGVNIGFRVPGVSIGYNPGMQLFYEGMNGSAKLNYNDVKLNIHSQHNLIGGAFDNYVLLSHNKHGLLGTSVDRFLVFGLEIGKIKSRYTLPLYTDATVYDDGSFYGIKVDYLTENIDGIGLMVGAKILETETQLLPHILEFRLGSRVTF